MYPGTNVCKTCGLQIGSRRVHREDRDDHETPHDLYQHFKTAVSITSKAQDTRYPLIP